jgi:hypothetical protein
MIRRAFCFFCLVLAWAADARAQTVTDERVWFVLLLQENGSAESPWRWTFETLARSRDGVSDLDTLGLRPTIIYALDSHSAVGGGYAVVPGFPASGGTTIEQRVYGQYTWNGPIAGGTLALRTRVESRFIEDNSGPLGRFRQQVRFSHAVRKGSRLSVVAYDEFFVHVNNTTRTARGVDQNRAFAGISVNLPRSTRIETGYLNQFSPGHRGAPDRVNHVLSSALVVGF